MNLYTNMPVLYLDRIWRIVSFEKDNPNMVSIERIHRLKKYRITDTTNVLNLRYPELNQGLLSSLGFNPISQLINTIHLLRYKKTRHYLVFDVQSQRCKFVDSSKSVKFNTESKWIVTPQAFLDVYCQIANKDVTDKDKSEAYYFLNGKLYKEA